MYTCLHNTHVHTHINLPNRGDSLIVQKGDVSACAWMDRKVVMMFSNAHPTATPSVLRRLKDHTHTPISCPEAIQLYNKYMAGVDRGDQLREYYACRTKSRKFYRYIFYFLFDIAITNAHILQKNFCPENVHKNVKEFRLQLAWVLMGDYSCRCTLSLLHFPIRIPDKSLQKNFKPGRCAYCKESHLHKDTTWFCRECEVWLYHNGDVHGDCFLQWHKGMQPELWDVVILLFIYPIHFILY